MTLYNKNGDVWQKLIATTIKIEGTQEDPDVQDYERWAGVSPDNVPKHLTYVSQWELGLAYEDEGDLDLYRTVKISFPEENQKIFQRKGRTPWQVFREIKKETPGVLMPGVSIEISEPIKMLTTI